MASTPEEIGSGRVIIVAHIEAKPGRGDEVEKAISDVRDHALSDKEPGTHVYRVTRHGDSFAIFEEYDSAAAVHQHAEVGLIIPLVVNRKDDFLVSIEWKHYKEF